VLRRTLEVLRPHLRVGTRSVGGDGPRVPQPRHPRLVMQAISAVDIALWDLAARLAELPLAALFGTSRDAVTVYAPSAPGQGTAVVAEAVDVALAAQVGRHCRGGGQRARVVRRERAAQRREQQRRVMPRRYAD
jgi:L-alanine-DL-glutamate epimerase-like enolase superfamily enzyme